MYCKECGQKIEDDSKFCKHCGKTLDAVQDVESETSIVPTDITPTKEITPNNIHCPKFKHVDNIVKVSSVYSSGVSEGSYAGVGTSLITPFSSSESSSLAITPMVMGGVNITELSKRLAPPPPPVYPNRTWFIVFLVLACLSLVSFFGIPLVAVFAPLAIWQGVRVNNLTKEAKEYTPLYKKMMIGWNKLYYCVRDDIVFNPETNEYAEPENMYDLIKNDMDTDSPPVEA